MIQPGPDGGTSGTGASEDETARIREFLHKARERVLCFHFRQIEETRKDLAVMKTDLVRHLLQEEISLLFGDEGNLEAERAKIAGIREDIRLHENVLQECMDDSHHFLQEWQESADQVRMKLLHGVTSDFMASFEDFENPDI